MGGYPGRASLPGCAKVAFGRGVASALGLGAHLGGLDLGVWATFQLAVNVIEGDVAVALGVVPTVVILGAIRAAPSIGNGVSQAFKRILETTTSAQNVLQQNLAGPERQFFQSLGSAPPARWELKSIGPSLGILFVITGAILATIVAAIVIQALAG